MEEKHTGLTLIRQEVQHGLQQEGQVANRQTRVAHATRGVNKLVEEAHLYSSPASVGPWKRERDRGEGHIHTSSHQISADSSIHFINDKGILYKSQQQKIDSRRQYSHIQTVNDHKLLLSQIINIQTCRFENKLWWTFTSLCAAFITDR